MRPNERSERGQAGLFGAVELESLLDQRQDLYRLAGVIRWSLLEEGFLEFYSDRGRPALPIRRMAGLLILKQLYNLSDEVVCERWRENPYMQYCLSFARVSPPARYCGETHFRWGYPCEPSELVHFRQRVGEKGVGLILRESIELHREAVEAEDELVADTTVQEANVTYPTETKLRERVIRRLWRLGEKKGLKWERSFKRTVPNLLYTARSRSNRQAKARRKAINKLRTVGRSLLRQYRARCGVGLSGKEESELETMERILRQKHSDAAKDRVHSLHDPTVCCIGKGKAGKPYEWGRKAGFASLAQSGVIVGVASFEENLYDGDTLAKTLASATTNTGKLFKSVLVDRGYKGQTRNGSTEVVQPGRKGPSGQSASQKRQHRQRMNRRAAIEPVIGHLKHDHRMVRCYLKGFTGSVLNAYLAAAAWNFRKWMRASAFLCLLTSLWRTFCLTFASALNRTSPSRFILRPILRPAANF